MPLSEKIADVMRKELAVRTPEHRERLALANENFDRLVRAGLVSPETYQVQPASPSLHNRLHARRLRS
jgi:hypothetical protein